MIRKISSNIYHNNKAIFMTLVFVLAAVVTAQWQLPPDEAFAGGGGGGKSGITQECGETVCNVSMVGSTFAPDILKVRPNSIVVWTNTDKVIHTVTSGDTGNDDEDILFDSGLSAPIAGGEKWEHEFGTPGTFEYFCQVHPRMVAQVIVGGDAIQEEFSRTRVMVAIGGVALTSVITAILLLRWNKKKSLATR